MEKPVQVLFVCMGNICRSPTAEAVFYHLVEAHGLQQKVIVDSAGTHAYHVGESPDARAMKSASMRGYDLSALRARKIIQQDLELFDYVLAMDQGNMRFLQQLGNGSQHARIELLLDYHPDRTRKEVPDPYYGGTSGFDHVLDLVEPAALNLLKEIVERHRL